MIGHICVLRTNLSILEIPKYGKSIVHTMYLLKKVYVLMQNKYIILISLYFFILYMPIFVLEYEEKTKI